MEFGTLVAILLLAAVVEAVVEYFIKPALLPKVESGTDRVDWRALALRWISAAFGVGLCIAYRADVLAMLGVTCPVPWVGWIATGLLIGRGANFISDFAGRWLRPLAGS